MLESVVATLPAVFREAPIACGVILGSGWGDVLSAETVHARLPYNALAGYGASTVVGHHGELLLMTLGGKRVVVFSGRRHYYEGCSWEQVLYPVELLRCLGVKTLLLTNAAGGINPAFRPGDFMVLTDHLNLTGVNPLRGTLREGWGTRFPDMSHVYDPELIAKLLQLAEVRLHQGVYAFSTGPSYETPAEIRAWRLLGADAVGMSTVPEAVVACACGMRVAGISCITNLAAGLSSEALCHVDILTQTVSAQPRMAKLITQLIQSL
ncbi:MAG: purine-nucleoside phosphorylase [Kiritimatiellia bacterium]